MLPPTLTAALTVARRSDDRHRTVPTARASRVDTRATALSAASARAGSRTRTYATWWYGRRNRDRRTAAAVGQACRPVLGPGPASTR